MGPKQQRYSMRAKQKRKSFFPKLPLLPKLFIAMLSGVLVAAGAAQALAMLHH
jgi:hypothetical protein